jgi:hypothetical protein
MLPEPHGCLDLGFGKGADRRKKGVGGKVQKMHGSCRKETTAATMAGKPKAS